MIIDATMSFFSLKFTLYSLMIMFQVTIFLSHFWRIISNKVYLK